MASESKGPVACEPPRKRSKRPTISENVMSANFQSKFSRHWHERLLLDSAELCVETHPFRLCKISNFIGCEAFMEDLKVELAEVKSRRQSIDLYQFEQTSDLATVDTPSLRRLWDAFRGEFANWMESNTRIELNGKISMSSSVYYDTDYLLCHDDNMGDRRIAFVLYLSKDWCAEDGGTLDLFDTDENGGPRAIVRSLVPEYNSLVFFEVHDDSYHQVSEVKSAEKSRWTINGWFHGPPVASARKPRPELGLPLVRPDAQHPCDLKPWIRNCYLDAGVARNVQKTVEANSYAFLANFFIADAYETLSEEMTSDVIVWQRVGPPDVRNYEIAEPDSLPAKLREFYRLFANIELFALLKDYTELDLVPNVKDEGDPRMSIELQRWSNGCYTLMCDKGLAGEDERNASRCEQDRFSPRKKGDDGVDAASPEEKSNASNAEDASMEKGTDCAALVTGKRESAESAENKLAALSTKDNLAALRAEKKLAAPSAEEKLAAPSAQDKLAVPSTKDKLAAPSAEEKLAAPSVEEKLAALSSEGKLAAAPSAEEKLAGLSAEEKYAAPSAEDTFSATNAADKLAALISEEKHGALDTENNHAAPPTTENELAEPSAADKLAAPIAEESHRVLSTEDQNAAPTTEDELAAPSAEYELAALSAEDKLALSTGGAKFVAPSSEKVILKCDEAPSSNKRSPFSGKKLITADTFERPAPPAGQFARLDKRDARKCDSREDRVTNSPSGSGTDESGDSFILKRLLKGKSRAEKKAISHSLAQHASCSSLDEKSDTFRTESEDSDVSDIGDYLSDRFECSIENSGEEDDEEEEEDNGDCPTSPSTCEPGSLDVIVQFNTGQVSTDETIDYVDPNQQEGALIHVPFRDNHLCLAYKTIRTTRLHKYVNHYCKGYFYNLICTYYE